MTGFSAAQRHKNLRSCGTIPAASARSRKTEITQWAHSGLAAVQRVVFTLNTLSPV